MKIEFREVNPNSFDEVRLLFITHEWSWRDSDPLGFEPKTEEQRDKTAKHFMKVYKEQTQKEQGLCAFDGTRMVGSHVLEIYHIDGKLACHIHGLWIDSEYRGKGIASKLKEMGEKWAIEKGCSLMDSNVRVTNESMIALNKKMGYEITRFNFRKNL